MDTMIKQMKLFAVALAAGLFIWAGGAMAGEPLAKEDTLSLGPAVSTDELKTESGMINIGAIGIADAEQNAEQNITNSIASDGSVEMWNGEVTMDPGAINTNTMTIVATNTGNNVVMSNQILLNLNIVNGEVQP